MNYIYIVDISTAIGEQHFLDGDQFGGPHQGHSIGDFFRFDIWKFHHRASGKT